MMWAEAPRCLLDALHRSSTSSPATWSACRAAASPSADSAPARARAISSRIDAPGASVRFFIRRRIRLTVGGGGEPEVELAVVRGSRAAVERSRAVMLAEGERSPVKEGGVPARPAPRRYAPDSRSNTSDEEDALRSAPDLEAFQRSSAGGAYGGTPYLPNELYGYETVARSERHVDVRIRRTATSGIRASPSDWRPYYRRPVASRAALRLDLGRRRALGVADASLRPLGIPSARAGSGFPRANGARRGSRGRSRRATSAGARSAGTDRPVFGFASFGTPPWSPRLRSVARLDRRELGPLRPRLRRPPQSLDHRVLVRERRRSSRPGVRRAAPALAAP